MPYALCPMPYALCPMPYALCPMPARAPHVAEKGYIRSCILVEMRNTRSPLTSSTPIEPSSYKLLGKGCRLRSKLVVIVAWFKCYGKVRNAHIQS